MFNNALDRCQNDIYISLAHQKDINMNNKPLSLKDINILFVGTKDILIIRQVLLNPKLCYMISF